MRQGQSGGQQRVGGRGWKQGPIALQGHRGLERGRRAWANEKSKVSYIY